MQHFLRMFKRSVSTVIKNHIKVSLSLSSSFLPLNPHSEVNEL